MINISKTIPKNSVIFDITDFHSGSPRTDEDLVNHMMNEISQSPSSYLLLKGSIIDAHKYKSQRSLMATLPSQQMKVASLVERLTPIADRILALGCSPKEVVGQEIASRLGVSFGGLDYSVQLIDDTGAPLFSLYATSRQAKIKHHQPYSMEGSLAQLMANVRIADCLYKTATTNLSTQIVAALMEGAAPHHGPWQVCAGGFFRGHQFCPEDIRENYPVNSDFSMDPPQPTGYLKLHVIEGVPALVERVSNSGIGEPQIESVSVKPGR